MTETRLTAELTRTLRGKDLSYPEVGATRGALPPGYQHVDRESVLGTGERTFAEASQALLSWQLQRRAGVRVLASSDTVDDGAVAVLLLGFGPLALRAPVRVVYLIDEPNRKGFAYGTLPGHPETGEEAFVVEQRDDGRVVCRVTAFSRPDTWYTRLGGPAATLTQRWVTGRYLRSLRPRG